MFQIGSGEWTWHKQACKKQCLTMMNVFGEGAYFKKLLWKNHYKRVFKKQVVHKYLSWNDVCWLPLVKCFVDQHPNLWRQFVWPNIACRSDWMNIAHTWDSARRPDMYEKFLLDKVTMYRPMLQVHRQPRLHWKVKHCKLYDCGYNNMNYHSS